MDVNGVQGYRTLISIHALLAESDFDRDQQDGDRSDFYPRSPCGERPYGRINDISRLIFLSTLSLRRATIGAITYVVMTPNFYPRSPCGERRSSFVLHLSNQIISIHALLAESDPFSRFGRMMRRYFYPRSPCGERHVACSNRNKLCDFYPRSPCGERQY